MITRYSVGVKLHLRHNGQTDERIKKHVCLFTVSVRDVHPTSGRSVILHRNLRVYKIRDQPTIQKIWSVYYQVNR